jgi:anaphase-promoting complex subunit 5
MLYGGEGSVTVSQTLLIQARHDLTAASYLLEQLSGTSPGLAIDPDLAFQVKLLRIDYLQRIGSFEEAYNTIEDLAEQLQADDADIYQRIHVMVLKALLWSKLGKAEKGFTVAMRAASAAWNARILPALWEAWGAIANILGVLGEFEAQRKVLEGIIPQALGCGDMSLCAQLYSWQADACMGLAGLAEANSISRASWVSKAETYLDRASNCKCSLVSWLGFD